MGGFVTGDAVSLLDLTGRLISLALTDVKFIAYVRDFNLAETDHVERSLRRTFLARPRTEGLWVRVTFRSGDALEGIASPGLGLLDEVLDVHGLQLTPPDTRTNTQRVYIPRAAMMQLDLLGVVSASSRRRRPVKSTRIEGQDELFETAGTN